MRPETTQLLAGSLPGGKGHRAGRIRVSYQTLKVRAQVRSRPVTKFAVLLKSLGDNLFELDGDRGIQTRRRNRGTVQDGIKNHAGRVSDKRALPGAHFIKDQAQGEKIGAFVEFLTADLLGGHVGDCAQSHAIAGEMSVLGGDSKIPGRLPGPRRCVPASAWRVRNREVLPGRGR